MSKVTLNSSKTHEWNVTNGLPQGNVELWPEKGHVKIVLSEHQPNGSVTQHNSDTPDVVAHEAFSTNTKNHWKIEVTATSTTPGAEVKYTLAAPGLH